MLIIVLGQNTLPKYNNKHNKVLLCLIHHCVFICYSVSLIRLVGCVNHITHPAYVSHTHHKRKNV